MSAEQQQQQEEAAEAAEAAAAESATLEQLDSFELRVVSVPPTSVQSATAQLF